MQRRHFLQTATASLGFGVVNLSAAEPITPAKRPQPPYRVWFQPRGFERDMSLYRNMTVDASGWLDPRLCELAGKTGLRWVYGTNFAYADGPKYWQQECSTETRTGPGEDSRFVSAGVAIDEWVPPQNPKIEAWIAQGLRAARAKDPDIFISVWFTDLRPALTELIQDGTVDLAIVEGYTHTPARFGLEAWLAWPTCLRRCDAAEKAGVLDRTIFCFGHITDEPSIQGKQWDRDWLKAKAHEIKERYPAMPGIAFYQSDSPDTPELRDLVRFCDRLSGELWS